MIKKRISLFLLLLSTQATGSVWSQPLQDTRRELEEQMRLNRRLNYEYDLAHDGKAYLVVNVDDKRIELRIRRVVLKSLIMKNVQILGQRFYTTKLLTLVRRVTSLPPQRPQIIPPETELASTQASNEPQKTDLEQRTPEMRELRDMPSRYSLVFDNGLTLRVSPANVPVEEEGFHGRVVRLSTWLSDMWSQVKGRPSKGQAPVVYVALSAEDCKSIFWSFPQGSRALFIL